MNDKEKISPPTTGGGSGFRAFVLLGILAVLLGAVAYDYLYAQKQAQKLHDEIFAFCDDSVAKTSANADNKPKLYTPKDIHEFLGEKFNGGKEYLPSKVTVVPGHIVETYSIMAGAVIRTYDVHVIYTANDPASAKEGRSEAKFSTLCLGEFPKADLVPQNKAPDVPVAPPSGPPSIMSSGGGGGGRGRPANGDAASSGEKKEEEKKDESRPEGEKKPDRKSNPEAEKKEEPKPAEKPNAAEIKPSEEKPGSEKPAEKPPEEKPADPKL